MAGTAIYVIEWIFGRETQHRYLQPTATAQEDRRRSNLGQLSARHRRRHRPRERTRTRTCDESWTKTCVRG